MQDGSAAGLGESLFDPETSSLLLGALKDEGIEHSQVRSDSCHHSSEPAREL